MEEKAQESAEEESADDEEADVKMEEDDEEPPRVELDDQEKLQLFRKSVVTDLSSWTLAASFSKFTLPDKSEGFDEMKFEWYKEKEAAEYVRSWVLERKLTIRIEDLRPGEWFRAKWSEWQRTLQTWRAKQQEARTTPPKPQQALQNDAADKGGEAAVDEKKEG